MFRAARCSSSGGEIVSPQPLVSSPSVNSMQVDSGLQSAVHLLTVQTPQQQQQQQPVTKRIFTASYFFLILKNNARTQKHFLLSVQNRYTYNKQTTQATNPVTSGSSDNRFRLLTSPTDTSDTCTPFLCISVTDVSPPLLEASNFDGVRGTDCSVPTARVLCMRVCPSVHVHLTVTQ